MHEIRISNYNLCKLTTIRTAYHALLYNFAVATCVSVCVARLVTQCLNSFAFVATCVSVCVARKLISFRNIVPVVATCVSVCVASHRYCDLFSQDHVATCVSVCVASAYIIYTFKGRPIVATCVSVFVAKLLIFVYNHRSNH